MKKYFIFVVAIVALVVMASGCTSSQTGNNSTATKAYSSNGISFNYPSDWVIINETSNATLTGVILGDVNYKTNNGTNGNGVVVLKIPQTNNSSAEVATLKTQFTNGTNSTITIAGVTANETSLNVTENNVTAQLKFVDFTKNNFVYLIQYTSVANGTQTESGLFDTITKSLQVT